MCCFPLLEIKQIDSSGREPETRPSVELGIENLGYKLIGIFSPRGVEAGVCSTTAATVFTALKPTVGLSNDKYAPGVALTVSSPIPLPLEVLFFVSLVCLVIEAGDPGA